MIKQIEYQAVLQEIGAVAFALAPHDGDADYAHLIREFEKTAAALVESADDLLDDAFSDHRMVSDPRWQREVNYCADELHHYPRLIVNAHCPPRYDTLKLFYEKSAECCDELSSSLRDLTKEEHHHLSLDVRLAYADGEWAAVNAHATARAIYLEHHQADERLQAVALQLALL